MPRRRAPSPSPGWVRCVSSPFSADAGSSPTVSSATWTPSASRGSCAMVWRTSTTDAAITRVEWKTRGHDHAPGLHEALLQNGFVPDERESIMVGEARALAVRCRPAPRRPPATRDRGVRRPRHGSDAGRGVSATPSRMHRRDALLHRLSLDDGMQLWIAEANGEIVTAGRLEPVANTDFAGIWGGATRSEWRGRGIYRAITAARARAAIALGKTLIHSDSDGVLAPDPGAGRSDRRVLDHPLPLEAIAPSPRAASRASGDPATTDAMGRRF